MQIKTSELTGWHLDYAVAVAEGYKRYEPQGDDNYIELEGWYDVGADRDEVEGFTVSGAKYEPSTDWAQGGPIIERGLIAIDWSDGNGWCASSESYPYPISAATPLIAAMRCYVASKLGDTVDIPENLT